MGTDEEFTDETELPPFPPEGAGSPEGATIGSGGEIQVNVETGIQKFEFRFCFYVNGRFWGQAPVWAPDADSAALSAQQTAGLYQMVLKALYPRAVISVTASPC